LASAAFQGVMGGGKEKKGSAGNLSPGAEKTWILIHPAVEAMGQKGEKSFRGKILISPVKKIRESQKSGDSEIVGKRQKTIRVRRKGGEGVTGRLKTVNQDYAYEGG